jgi:hypothetical protein
MIKFNLILIKINQIMECKNCGSENSSKYCTYCGQKTIVPVFTIKQLVSEVIHSMTHADKSVFSYIKNLIINPGKVAREYIVEGKRKKYFNPFTFFLLISGFCIFIQNKTLNLKEDLFKLDNEYGRIFLDYFKLFSVFEILILAIICIILFSRKPRYIYGEYIVFIMILFSSIQIFDSIFAIINYFSTKLMQRDISIDDNIFYPILLCILSMYYSYQFHKESANNTKIQVAAFGLLIPILNVLLVMFVIWSVLRDFHGLGIFNVYGLNFG